MPPERIQVALSPFEKLQVLRHELEERKEELVQVENEIREKLGLLERQRYLESLSPFYAANRSADLPTRDAIDALETRRGQLIDLVSNIEATIPLVLGSTEGKEAPSAPSAAPVGQARKAKFDSFDDFKASRE